MLGLPERGRLALVLAELVELLCELALHRLHLALEVGDALVPVAQHGVALGFLLALALLAVVVVLARAARRGGSCRRRGRRMGADAGVLVLEGSAAGFGGGVGGRRGGVVGGGHGGARGRGGHAGAVAGAEAGAGSWTAFFGRVHLGEGELWRERRRVQERV